MTGDGAYLGDAIRSNSTSYGGIVGDGVGAAISVAALGCRPTPISIQAANGTITYVAPITIAAVIDGLSATITIAERATSVFGVCPSPDGPNHPRRELYE